MKVKRPSSAGAMSPRSGTRMTKRHPAMVPSRRLINVVLAACLGIAAVVVPVESALADTNDLTLRVESARTQEQFNASGASTGTVHEGDPITAYSWMINEDNTGTTEQRAGDPQCSPQDPNYATGANECAWASIAGLATSAPIYASGDEGDLDLDTALSDLPQGRYLISVLADGFKIDGEHFEVPFPGDGQVTVRMQPTPLPTATIQAQVFADTAQVNGQFDTDEVGLAGFEGHIKDILGEVSTDIFGNPLCTTYVTGSGPNGWEWQDDGPVVDQIGGSCLSDASGLLTIPNLGTNRYTLLVVPPDANQSQGEQTWIQTTTLEGNHDWDAWVMEGASGADTEFVVRGEPFPAIIFGFVPAPTPRKPSNGSKAGWFPPFNPQGNADDWVYVPASGPPTNPTPPSWHGPALNGTRPGLVKGVVSAVKVYTPTTGGYPVGEAVWGGLNGAKMDHPIKNAWVVLNDLDSGDQVVWIGQANADGAYNIPNVPPGTYSLTYWDEPQDYILDIVNVTVGPGPTGNGEVVDTGIGPLAGWWTTFEGTVFNDTNRNGVKDPGEPGVPNYTLTLRRRENSLMDRGTTTVTTDQSGHYFFESAYPLTEWVVMEAYSDLWYTTGVTYQSDNQPTPTTVVGAGVDVSTLPIIGLGGSMDWGVHAYDPTGASCAPAGSYENCLDPRNGGIVGTVSYDTTRNELDPRYAAVEDWQPGVPDLTVDLYQPIDCGTHPTAPCDEAGDYELALDGSLAHGDNPINSYITETWERPTDCVARKIDGSPLTYPLDQQVLPTDAGAQCLEGPLMGVQYQTGFSTVDGNYGFADGCFVSGFGSFDAEGSTVCADSAESPAPLPAGDYLVKVNIPDDAMGNPTYKFTREEDINIGNGDAFIPQQTVPTCAGSLHTVDVAGIAPNNVGPVTIPDPSGLNPSSTITVPASEPTVNDTFANDVGGSPYEGTQKPLCDTKLVTLSNGRSVVPTFNVFTDVPLPGRFFGLLVDDLNFSSDPTSLLFGEKRGIPFAPVGIYDFMDEHVTTVETDFNGIYDVLLPSTNRINCPTPSGVCTNVYRFVGNDPGYPGRLNPNYSTQYRTIAAEFEAMPGSIIPADNAPTQMGTSIQLPGGQTNQQVTCPVNDPTAPTTPELFRVSKPYADLRTGLLADRQFSIDGQGFGSSGTVTLDNGAIVLPTAGWTDRHIDVTVPSTTAGGVHRLTITRADTGRQTINGLTFHVLAPAQVVEPGWNPSSISLLDNFNGQQAVGGNWSVNPASALLLPLANPAIAVANYVLIPPSATPLGYLRARIANNAGAEPQSNPSMWWTGGGVLSTNQEAAITFTQPSAANTADEQGLLLKYSGGASPNATTAQWVEVVIDNSPAGSVRIRTKSTGPSVITTNLTISGVSFVNGDILGARALQNGDVVAYRNGVEIGRVNVPATGAWTGRAGLRFEGTGTGTPSTAESRVDNFRAGNVSVTGVPAYSPILYEVGPGKTYDPGLYDQNAPSHAIQDAINAAVGNPADDLIVVYPGNVQGNRINPFGAYFENLIVHGPVKIQGVGPGGVYPDGTPVYGSMLDGTGYGGDTQATTDWRTTVASIPFVGNQTLGEGAVVTLIARSNTQYGATYPAQIDGFDIRGGDMHGFPTVLTGVGAVPGDVPEIAIDQGGAIYANSYVRNLRITNNVVEHNTGAFGAIRIGNPELPAPDNQNDNLMIADNRILANGGSNLAGGIGIFAGADGYSITRNDICGNFSSEYGGGVSIYGLSPNGSIDHNRIYYNRSYDEGGGIMIAGALPANPNSLSPGSGSVTIDANLIQGNLADDDGGGIRFLQAGFGTMNVTNNMIVNDVSADEGGGISINDAPNVRVINNTIMKNITTATAVTSNGSPAPAGLSTGRNSDQLVAAGAPAYSDPLLFNNIFWDNRAGSRGGPVFVTGIGSAGDVDINNVPVPVNNWDLGVPDLSFDLSPTNSILQTTTGTNTSPSNTVGTDPGVVATYDTTLLFQPWRTNANFTGAILVAQDLPVTMIAGDYHLATGSSAVNLGAATKATVPAPTLDIDRQTRVAAPDAGADELNGLVPNASFPRTGFLDRFNRANGALGADWATTGTFAINGNAARATAGGTALWLGSSSFGPNQEAYVTFADLSGVNPSQQGVVLKHSGSNPAATSASWIEVTYDDVHHLVVLRTKSGSGLPVTRLTIGATFVNGDTLGARAQSDGRVTIFKVSGGTVSSIGSVKLSVLGSVGGRIGLRAAGPTFPDPTIFDDFGGGTMP